MLGHHCTNVDQRTEFAGLARITEEKKSEWKKNITFIDVLHGEGGWWEWFDLKKTEKKLFVENEC